ncbi:MAG: hypothetical protein ACP5OR_00805 [Candidatus Dormibacteria bacterium]
MTEQQITEKVTNTATPNNESTTTSRREGYSQNQGARMQVRTPHIWSGKSPVAEFIWLVAGVVIIFLALDFVFHAAGANNVGFAAFVFSIGTFLASPFAGIFKTTYAAHGNLVVWADVVAVGIYSLAAFGIVKLVTIVAGRHNADRTT